MTSKNAQFPHGRLGPDDKGAVRIAVSARENRVVIVFEDVVSWIGLTKTDAIFLAEILLKHAAELE